METAIAGIAIAALQALIKEAPTLFATIQQALSKPDVTVEDIEKLKQQIASDTYEKIVTNSQVGGS